MPSSTGMVLALLLLLLRGSLAAQQVPDTIYYGGKVITVAPGHPVVEAVAIRGDRSRLSGVMPTF